ncbi:MAG: response regulator [Halobacteriovoraceae bacterium]|nr:response regulator [Halobacteriovoraceae bacterium]
MSDTLGHIVVVDDEEELANILSESFELENFKVTEFHSAEDALSQIFNIDFDVIISDAHMPGMNGMDFLREVKSKKTEPFFFFLCTGDLEITETALMEAGGTALIPKPYNLFDLIEIVTEHLQKK